MRKPLTVAAVFAVWAGALLALHHLVMPTAPTIHEPRTVATPPTLSPAGGQPNPFARESQETP